MTPKIFIVDDDPAVCSSLRWLVESAGLTASTYTAPSAFLADITPDCAGCLVLDFRMPDMTGLEVQRTLYQRNVHLPVILITAHADVPTALTAMKQGAVDLLEKPFDDQILLERIQTALARDAAQRERRQLVGQALARQETLTPREREVMDLVVEGLANKQVAARLGLSEKTVEIHRSRVMRKMQAGSLAELVKLALLCQPATLEAQEAALALHAGCGKPLSFPESSRS